MHTPEKIIRKIKALIAQAHDRAGTPEGDTFMEKALTLMADYGVEQAQVDNSDGDAMVSETIEISGIHTMVQALLASSIATALHCCMLGTRASRKSTRYISVTIYGRRRHVERAKMLFLMLNPEMMASATKVRGSRDKYPFITTAEARRSFMAGFAVSIGERLEALEAERAGAYATAGTSGDLVLIDDAQRAEAWMQDQAGTTGRTKNVRVTSLTHHEAGLARGESVDIGQTRVGGMRALAC